MSDKIIYQKSPGYGVPTDDEELEAVATQLDEWRENRVKGQRGIPEHFWNAIIRLCDTRNVSFVAKRCRLQSQSVQERLQKVPRKLPESSMPTLPVPTGNNHETATTLMALTDYVDDAVGKLLKAQEKQFASIAQAILSRLDRLEKLVSSQQEALSIQEGGMDIMLEGPDGTTFKLNALHSSEAMYELVREFIANMREARLVAHEEAKGSTHKRQ